MTRAKYISRTHTNRTIYEIGLGFGQTKCFYEDIFFCMYMHFYDYLLYIRILFDGKKFESTKKNVLFFFYNAASEILKWKIYVFIYFWNGSRSFCWFVAWHCFYFSVRIKVEKNPHTPHTREADRRMIFNCRPLPSPLLSEMLSANSKDIHIYMQFFALHKLSDWEAGSKYVVGYSIVGVAHVLHTQNGIWCWSGNDGLLHTHTYTNAGRKYTIQKCKVGPFFLVFRFFVISWLFVCCLWIYMYLHLWTQQNRRKISTRARVPWIYYFGFVLKVRAVFC